MKQGREEARKGCSREAQAQVQVQVQVGQGAFRRSSEGAGPCAADTVTRIALLIFIFKNCGSPLYFPPRCWRAEAN